MMSSGQEGKDSRCVGCKDYHKSDYAYPCKVCAHIDANMAKDWYEDARSVQGYATPEEMFEAMDKEDKDEQEYLDKLINDHWAYIEALLKAHGNELDAGIAEFHYKSAFRHGFKHCKEYLEETGQLK